MATTRLSPHNQNKIPVSDKHGNPLDPTRPSRVATLLKQGRAKKVWVKGIFTIQMLDLDSEDCETGDFALGIDPGLVTGIAITRENGKNRTVVGKYELHHRNREIKRNLQKRAMYRRTRRSRLRYRPTRYHNRKKSGLTPSLRSIVEDHRALLELILSLYPITHIRYEDVSFDTRRGPAGTREFILARDNHQCQYCDSFPDNLELDHIIPISNNGPTVASNLITACHSCNQRKGKQDLEEFLAHDPERLISIQGMMKDSQTAAGNMNSTRQKILAVYQGANIPLTITNGFITSKSRTKRGIIKSHTNDAACLDNLDSVNGLECSITILKRIRRHKRQSIRNNKYGSPMSKEFPNYSRLSRAVQGFTTPPAHSIGPRRLRGIRSSDIVKIQHKNGIWYYGFCIIGIKRQRIFIPKINNGSEVSTSFDKVHLIAHSGRWITE